MTDTTAEPTGSGHATPDGVDELGLHFLLTRALAHRHGVDLAEALGTGFLARADFVRMAEACRHCTGAPDDCRDFLATEDRATATPPWCANTAVIDGLRDLG